MTRGKRKQQQQQSTDDKQRPNNPAQKKNKKQEDVKQNKNKSGDSSEDKNKNKNKSKNNTNNHGGKQTSKGSKKGNKRGDSSGGVTFSSVMLFVAIALMVAAGVYFSISYQTEIIQFSREEMIKLNNTIVTTATSISITPNTSFEFFQRFIANFNTSTSVLNEIAHFAQFELPKFNLPANLTNSLYIHAGSSSSFDRPALEFLDTLSNSSSTSDDDDDQKNTPVNRSSIAAQLDLLPIVMIPGIVSSSLEVWQPLPCASTSSFRQKMYGTTQMMGQLIYDRQCWYDHMLLDPNTGLDPPGVKLRVTTGIDSSAYLVPGFWIWGKLIENFADLGYDNNNLEMASYDWRLSFTGLEKRDYYMTKLKIRIETFRAFHNKKSVIITHSLGGNLWAWFVQWVSRSKEDNGGGGGPDWVDENVEAFINIGGPLLGLPKTVSSLISGEMKDTAHMGIMGNLVDYIFSKKQRVDLFRTWRGVASMLPKGGGAVWEDVENEVEEVQAELIKMDNSSSNVAKISALDTVEALTQEINEELQEKPNMKKTDVKKYNQMLYYLNKEANNTEEGLSVDASLDFMLGLAGESVKNYILELYHPCNNTEKEAQSCRWNNPLLVKLPKMPNSKIYCMYGVNKPTEKGYWYKKVESSQKEDVEWVIDGGFQEDGWKYGIKEGNGDGTVPLESLGYMCVKGWKEDGNEVGRIVTREYDHMPSALDLRGGKLTADHVDIMGNWDLTMDVLKIVSGKGGELDDRILSDVKQISEKIYARLHK